MEETDIRNLSAAQLDEAPDLVVIDVSFISLKLVLPAALALAKFPAQLVALIKPQFEAGRAALKRGIVRDAGVQAAVCDEISAYVSSLGWRVLGVMPSPITGGDGSVERVTAVLEHRHPGGRGEPVRRGHHAEGADEFRPGRRHVGESWPSRCRR